MKKAEKMSFAIKCLYKARELNRIQKQLLTIGIDLEDFPTAEYLLIDLAISLLTKSNKKYDLYQELTNSWIEYDEPKKEITSEFIEWLISQ